MAVPTIISVTPSDLVANTREQVVIAGTNFHVWPSLPWPNGGALVYFVFGSEEFLVNNIQVVSDSEIRCEAFRYMGDHKAATFKADIKIVNIDASGNPIAGEEVTLDDAVTYYKDQHLPGNKHRGEDFLELAVREVLLTFLRTIDATIAVATHVDWFPDGTIEHYVAEFPTLAIRAFGLEHVPHTPYDPDRDRAEGQEEEYLPSEYYWVTFQIVPMTEDDKALMNLWQAMLRMSQRVREIYVPKATGSTDRMRLKCILDPAGDFGFNYGVGTGTVTMNARLGPLPLETPEAVNRLWIVEEAFLTAFANISGTGTSRDTQFY